MLKAFVAAACVLGVSAVNGIAADVSLEGKHVEISKEAQKAEWIDMQDKAYNAKGFTQWKAVKDGFILKNLDSTLVSCTVKSKTPDKEQQIKVDFDCKEMAAKDKTADKVEEKVVKSALSAEARFRAKLRNKFTPMQDGHKLKPLDPELQYSFEADAAGALASHGTWGREVNIDDSVFEGEAQQLGETEHDEEKEHKFLNKVDVGPGTLFDEEESKSQTQRADKVKVSSGRTAQEVPHPNMVDTPYVNAGVDREVNDRMYEFFKKHPQYHTPEAHWRAARKWKNILSGSSGAEDESVGGGMWQQNSCDQQSKVPAGWPDVPEMKCRHYAVSPMGYWGCQWLFEDGTCGYIQYYPTIRWDGLDAYRTKHHDPADAALEHQGVFDNVYNQAEKAQYNGVMH